MTILIFLINRLSTLSFPLVILLDPFGRRCKILRCDSIHLVDALSRLPDE